MTSLLSLALASAPTNPIKTVQPKAYLKMHKLEVTSSAQFVANDPYLYRRMADLRLDLHVTEVFAVEVDVGYSPSFGENDLKPLARQLIEKNHVSADISRMGAYGLVGMSFAPIHGKTGVFVGSQRLVHFDLYGSALWGKVQTTDDLSVIGDGPEDQATQTQWHDVTSLGGGVRLSLGGPLALRLEARSFQYIEVVSSENLEMKGYAVFGAGISWFSPPRAS